MNQRPLLARAFVRAADTLADDFDVSAHLRELCRHYVDLLDIDAAEVVLGDDADSLRLVATSRALVLGADAATPYDHETPARRSFTTGEQVCVRDLRTAAPVFPRFVRTAMQAGYAAAHTFPLRLRTQIVGAVTVCRVRPGSLPPDQGAIAQSLADAATIGLLQQRAR
jgi:transcriptional regulator with GAF, ATPase, and Fis domain